MPVSHYENFPVASLLLPRRLREPVEAIYWFARSADDIADEGDHPEHWRLSGLDAYRQRLDSIAAGNVQSDARWEALASNIRQFGLPLLPFRDLLDAFAQDVTTLRYSNFGDLQDYCRRSANPVGRLMLHLYERTDDAAMAMSDAICTALQLLNFCQDVAVDWQKNRIYIPQDELRAMNVAETHIARGIVDARWQQLFDAQVGRAINLLREGSRLPELLRGRARLELRAIIAGGERIGGLLLATGGDVFRHRPQLGPLDWFAVGVRTVLPPRISAGAATATP
ncbi:MAG: squalene synthase HpnC [Betaproteobacteria bacterium]